MHRYGALVPSIVKALVHNYLTDLVLKLDIVLLSFGFFVLFLILINAGIKAHRDSRRIKTLRAIKRTVATCGATRANDTSGFEVRLSKDISAQTFLDVTTNRVREQVFFNQAEQTIFEKQYISRENIATLQTTATQSINKWHRIEAILALGYAGIETSFEILKANLFNKDEDISYFSALALCRMRNMDSGRALLQFLRKYPFNRHKIVSMLGQFPAEITSEVIALTKDTDPSLRVCALNIMESTGTLDHTDSIERLLTDESVEVRAAACRCLGVVGNTNTAALLKRYLNDDAWLVRAQALQALDRLLGGECVELIINMIKDNSWLVIDALKTVLAKHINIAIAYLETILAQHDILAKQIAVEIIEMSGHIDMLYAALLESGAKAAKSLFLLEGMIKAGAHNGLDLAFCAFNEDQKQQIYMALNAIDNKLARRPDNDSGSKHNHL